MSDKLTEEEMMWVMQYARLVELATIGRGIDEPSVEDLERTIEDVFRDIETLSVPASAFAQRSAANILETGIYHLP